MISILVPERGRPEALDALIWSIVTNDGGDERYEVLVAIDEDDPAWVDGREPVESKHVRTFRWPRPLTFGQKVNQLAEQAKGYILWPIANDFTIATPNWPEKIRAAVAGLPNGIGVCYPHDDLHPDHASFPIITTRMRKTVGFVWPPCYPYWFVDTHWDQLGVLLGVRFEVDTVRLVHQDPERAGATIGGRYELAFWVDFFRALTPLRLQESIQLINAAWPVGSKEHSAALADLPRRQQLAAARIAHMYQPGYAEQFGSAGGEPPSPQYAEVKRYAVEMMEAVQKQKPRRPKVTIATPSGRTYEAATANAIAACAAHSSLAGIDISLANVQSSAITHGRNMTVQLVLEQGSDWVFFVDSDMTFPPDTLLRLLRHEKDIVGATYSRRTPPHVVLGRLKPPSDIARGDKAALDAKVAKGGLYEAENLPGGLLLVNMQVYRTLAWPWYAECYRWVGADNLDSFKKQMRDYFTVPPPEDVLASIDGTSFGDWLKSHYEVAIDSGSQDRYLSEDLFFSTKARRAGFSLWCDMDVTFSARHLGVLEVSTDRPVVVEAVNVAEPLPAAAE